MSMTMWERSRKYDDNENNGGNRGLTMIWKPLTCSRTQVHTGYVPVKAEIPGIPRNIRYQGFECGDTSMTM